MKVCFKCSRSLPLTEFYAHPMMADGHLGKCKDCTKSDAAKRYDSERDKIRQFEHDRARTPARRAYSVIKTKEYRKKYPEKARADTAVARALRSGKLVRLPCRICSSTDRVQAHHEDYSKPLDVEWLCFACHSEHRHGQKVG